MNVINAAEPRTVLTTERHTNQGPVKIYSESITVPTHERRELVKLTDEVRAFVEAAGVADGFIQISSLHTTAALFVNEWQDALLSDIKLMFERVVPRALYYNHNDPAFSDCDRSNADSHLSSLLLSHSLSIPVAHGQLVLGHWQNVIMAEFDGPNERRLFMQVLGI